MEKTYCPDFESFVLVRCMTYNHSKYIENALNGFAIQQTSFPFVCLVMDDCSTDGEQDVIKDWMVRECDMNSAENVEIELSNITIVSNKNNTNCIFAFYFLKENLYNTNKKDVLLNVWYEKCKYISICEGDDYWIYPQKLQVQVDFLEQHPEYVMCHTDFSLTNGGYRNHNVYVAPDDCYFPYSIQRGLQVGTLTVMYRAETYNRGPHLYKGKGWPMADMPMWIELSHEGKIKYLPIDTARYRVLVNSASHGSFEKELKFLEATREIHLFYANYYGVELGDDGYSKTYYTNIMKSVYKHHRTDVVNVFFFEACGKRMLSIKLVLFAVATYIKPLRYMMTLLYNGENL